MEADQLAAEINLYVLLRCGRILLHQSRRYVTLMLACPRVTPPENIRIKRWTEL